jgi:hypothetical protein
MSYSLPKYYFQDIHPDVREEIMSGMIEGKTEPTPEDMGEWLASDLERQAEALLAQTC